MSFEVSQEFYEFKVDQDSLFHSGIRPYNQWYLSDQTFNKSFKDTGDYFYDFTVLLFQKHLLEIHKKDVHIGVDALLDVYFGNRYYNDLVEFKHKVSTNSRGFRVVGNIGKKVSFETRFSENQFFYPNYVDSVVRSRQVAPGVGRVKKFKSGGWDVGNSMGVISLKINELTNLKFGHDKLFIGHGYRSLLLSDNASNYPLLNFNIRSKNNKWQYMTTYAWMQSLSRSQTIVSTEALFKKKNANFHYLSYKPTNWLELGIFEGTIYKRFEDTVGFVSPHPTFYNPVIGINTIVNGLQSENNSLIGVNASFLKSDYQIYGQFAIDDVDKMGYQIGAKWFAPFGLERNWFLVEFNTIPSYMYSTTASDILQNYSHMNQELAHPLGASFKEVVVIYNFFLSNWFANAQFNFTNRQREAKYQFGENILRASNDINIDGAKIQTVQTYFWRFEAGYNFNIKTRLQLFGQMTQRFLMNLDNELNNQKDFYFVFGMRCKLNNNYLDL